MQSTFVLLSFTDPLTEIILLQLVIAGLITAFCHRQKLGTFVTRIVSSPKIEIEKQSSVRMTTRKTLPTREFQPEPEYAAYRKIAPLPEVAPSHSEYRRVA
jgi:hypothetical protein